MKRIAVALAAVLAAGTMPGIADAQSPEAVSQPTVNVGAASRSVLPTVGGDHSYLASVNPDPTDPFDPGEPIAAWDQGRVSVGNGDDNGYWVHDDLEVTAVAFEPTPGGRITVVVSANLYMIFSGDADLIRSKVATAVGPALASRLDIAIHADHNHHGPDTAFDVNHDWFELMTDQVSAAVVESIYSMEPATLDVAETDHYFGLRDSRDPMVVDPTLGVLRATATSGDTIATMIFWGNHPEVTLFWGPPTGPLAADCALLGISADCHAEDRVFTSDFPGWATRIIEDELGGHAAFINGAVGDLITPLGANIWEVDETSPIGDGLNPPVGAQPPLGAANYTERNFRRTYLVGRELASAALDALEHSTPVTDTSIEYDEQVFYTRLSNIGFRFLLTVDPVSGFTALGHTPFDLFTCPATGPKDDSTCVDDGKNSSPDAVVGGDIRDGDHARSLVSYLRIGPVGTMWVPAEVGPETTIGLPAGYTADPTGWHNDPLDLHANGAGYQTSGFVKNLMDTPFRWVVGLGNDQLGYAVPLADYRVLCVADQLAGAGACQDLYDNGHIEFPDAVAGATCKAITEDPSLLATNYPNNDVREAVAGSCMYGQALGEADDHYEETNSLGWDLEADIIAAVSALTGISDPTTENSSFDGYWRAMPPPPTTTVPPTTTPPTTAPPTIAPATTMPASTVAPSTSVAVSTMPTLAPTTAPTAPSTTMVVPVPDGGELPATGADNGRLALIAAVLLLLGGGALATARRGRAAG